MLDIMLKNFSIAIDGPAGVGKSTVAKGVASVLGYSYIDTGAMYRAVTLLAMENNTDLNDAPALVKLVCDVNFDIINSIGKNIIVIVNGVDVSQKIRTPLVTQNVSKVASVPGVRKILVDIQKKMACNGSVVMEGRDIGTVVIPDAEFKFFLVASPHERARRRAKDFEKMGFPVNLEKLTEEIETRDYFDSTRETNPLRPAEDAYLIDCNGVTVEQVINMILKRVSGDLH